MQVFNEFIKTDLTEDQILPVLRDLLPVLLNILGSTQVCFIRYINMNYELTLTWVAYTLYPCKGSLCIPSMYNNTVYGKGTTSPGGQRGDWVYPSCLDRCIQGVTKRISWKWRTKCSFLGWSCYSDWNFQSMSICFLFIRILLTKSNSSDFRYDPTWVFEISCSPLRRLFEYCPFPSSYPLADILFSRIT